MNASMIPGFLPNADKIVSICDTIPDLFLPRMGLDEHSGFIPNISSRFKTLKDRDMPLELIDEILSSPSWDNDIRDGLWAFIQIQKYDIGDYIVPHRDTYFIQKLHLISLTTSDVDGLICETDMHSLEFIPDRAGQYIDFPYDAVHFVSPVRDHTRYSLVLGI